MSARINEHVCYWMDECDRYKQAAEEMFIALRATLERARGGYSPDIDVLAKAVKAYSKLKEELK